MKVEQACRFRLDEGYSVFAKSPGLLPSHEAALGNIFNSAMNNIFPQVGDSILTCTGSGPDVFLARNTLRTDIHGRKTMFTHAYIFPAEDYDRLMQTDPMAVLGVEMADMLENQSEGAQLPTLESLNPGGTADQVPELFAKYQLDPVRYSRLLLGAYLALTSDRSLQLVTDLPLDQTGPMVREMILCILEGLLPVLKGKLSFSTGPDTRMKISVVSTTCGSPSGELLFGVEDDRYTNIRPRDEVTELAFTSLASTQASQRTALLENMQNWLENAVDIQENLSLTMICTAQCLCMDSQLDHATLLKLFMAVSQAKGITTRVKNALLTDLVRQMNDGEGCSEDAISLISEWYLQDSDPAFRSEAERSLAACSQEICIALAEAAFAQEDSENVNFFITALLRLIPAGQAGITDSLKTEMVVWILRENREEFADYAARLMEDFPTSQLFELAKRILGNGRTRSLTPAEMTMLTKALQTLASDGKQLPEEYEALLDSQSSNYSDELKFAALSYFFYVRLAALSPADGLELVNTMAANYPGFFGAIMAVLPKGAAPQVWELYQTETCFTEGMDSVALANALAENNTFENPDGPFEQRAAEKIEHLVRSAFASLDPDRYQMAYYADPVAKNWLEYVDALHLSAEVRARLRVQVALLFWESIPMEMIYRNAYPIKKELAVELPETEDKLLMACLCLELREDMKKPESFIRYLTEEAITDRQRRALLEGAKKMLFVLLNEEEFLSWDLALLSCWTAGEKESGPDPKALQELCESLDKLLAQKKRIDTDADCSLLLKNDKLRKSVAKMSIQAEVFQVLLEQIKPEKGGLFSFFKKPEKKPEEKKPRGKNFYDPTALDFSGDHRKDKKDK